MPALLRDRRLIYVTGKGGVGRTTVAAALGLAAAAAGRRTIVCEVAEQDRIAQALGGSPAAHEHEIQVAERLWTVTVDPDRALEQWLRRHAGGAAYHALARSSAFGWLVAAAPGAKELITIAKVWEIAQPERWDDADRSYDLVIVDAPASGHGLAMLTAPRTYRELAPGGRVRRQAGKVAALLADPALTAYVAVALAEEMPVGETLELEGRLPDAVGRGLDAIVVNGLWPQRLRAAEARRLRTLAGERPPAEAATLRAALAADARARAQRSHLRRLRRAAAAPVVTLPFVFEHELGPAEYERLAAVLASRLDGDDPDGGGPAPRRS